MTLHHQRPDRLTVEEINQFNPSPENPLEVECDDGAYISNYQRIKIISHVTSHLVSILDWFGSKDFFTTDALKHYPSIRDRLGFQVGDKVRAFGVDGVVRQIEPTNSRPVLCLINYEWCRFTHYGCLETWHKEPSLKLIERPAKKVKKSFWLWALDGKTQTTIMDDNFMDINGHTCIKAPANRYTKIPGTEVVLEVDVSNDRPARACAFPECESASAHAKPLR